MLSGFAVLPEIVRAQNVPLGTSLEELNLPDTLKATVYTASEDTVPPSVPESPPAEPEEMPASPSELNDGEAVETPSAPSEDNSNSTQTPPADNATSDEETAPDATPSTEDNVTDEKDPADIAPPAENSNAPEDKEQAAEASDAVQETPASAAELTAFSTSVKAMQYLSVPVKNGVEFVTLSEPKTPLAASPSDAEPPAEPTETEKTVTIHGVTWESDPIYAADIAGTYTFTAVLPDGYMVEDGVSLPEITVIVEDAKRITVKDVITMIDALPSMEEWTAMDEDAARKVMNEILAAKKAYDALTAEEKAQIDEVRTKKLLELAEMAAQLAGILPMSGNVAEVTMNGTTTTYATFKKAWDAAVGDTNTAGAEVKLLGDVNKDNYFTASRAPITVPTDKIITLDLNGFTIDRGLTETTQEGCVILINGGTLTIDDNSTAKTGKITGGFADEFGGGVFVNGGSFTFNNGIISDNKASAGGGVAIIAGTAKLTGGTIAGNQAVNVQGTAPAGGLYVLSIGKVIGQALPIVELSGGIKIEGNTDANGKPSNVALELYTKETQADMGMPSPTEDIYSYLTISGALTNEIGVTRHNADAVAYIPTSGTVAIAAPDYNSGKLTAADLAHFTSDNMDYTPQLTADGKIELAADTPIAKGTSGTCSWKITSDGTLVIYPTNGVSGVLDDITGSDKTPWKVNSASIKKVMVQSGVKTNTYASYLFYNLSNCTEMDLSGLDTTAATSMSSMFYGCKGLTTLDVSKFDAAKVTSMSSMFYGCSGLNSLDLGNLNTANVANMINIFYGCSGLTTLDVSSFNTAKVTNMGYMFNECSKLTTITFGDNFNTTNVTSMSTMFAECRSLNTLDASGFDTAKVTNMTNMFANCSKLTTLDVSNFNTTNVTNMSGMFLGCSGLTTLDVSKLNTAKVTSIASMFASCSKLITLDVSNFDFSKVASTGSMFNLSRLALNTNYYKKEMGGTKIYLYGKSSKDDLTTTDLLGIEPEIVYLPYAITKNAATNGRYTVTTDAEAQNYFTKTAPLYTADGLTPPTYDSTKSYAQMGKTVTITFTPSSGYEVDTVTVTGASGTVTVSGTGNTRTFTMPAEAVTVAVTFDTAPIASGTSGSCSWKIISDGTLVIYPTDGVSGVLGSYSAVDQLPWYSNRASVKKVLVQEGVKTNTGAVGLFYYLGKCTEMDLSGLDTSDATDMNRMFESCYSLTSVDLSGFNTNKVTNMTDMFNGCDALTSLDLSNFNTSNVAEMSKMFSFCTALTNLDLSGFDFSRVTNMSNMLMNCTLALKTNYYKKDMGGTGSKIYLYGKSSKDDLTTTDLTGTEANIVYLPYAINKTAVTNGSYTVSTDAQAQNYFTKTAPFYTAEGQTPPTYDSAKSYAQMGKTVAITFTPNSGYMVDTITVTGASGTVTVSGTGNTRTFVMPKEAVTVAASFKLSDATAPTINVATPPTGWQNANTNLSVTYADNIGVTKLYVKTDSGAYTEISDFTASPHSYTVSTEGTHTYQFKAEDAAGNTKESNVVTVKLDKTAPASVAITYENTNTGLVSGFMRTITFGNFFNEAVKVNVQVTDAAGGSGVSGAKVEYQTFATTTDESEPSTGWQTATLDSNGKFSFTMDQAFKGIVWVRGYDVAGNHAVARKDLTLESTPPTITPPTDAPSADKWYDDEVSFTFSASDDNGIQSVTVSDTVSGGSEVVDNGDGTYTVTVTGSGEHKVQVTVTDNAGNVTLLPTDGYTVKIDDTVPTISSIEGNLTGDSWTKESIDLTVKSDTSAGSGQTITVTGPDGTVSVDANGKFTAEKNGTYTVTVTTGAGKTVTQTVTVDRIDKTAPANATVTLTPNVPDGDNGWYQNLSIAVTPPTADGGAPITTEHKLWKKGETEPTGYTELPVGGLPTIADGEYTLKLHTKDAAGNTSADSTHNFKLDKTAPVINTAGIEVDNDSKNLWDWIIGKTSLIITLPVSEVTSGMERLTYVATPDSGSPISGTANAIGDGKYEIALGVEFAGTVKVIATDKAGNTSGETSLTANGGKIIAEDNAPQIEIKEPATGKNDAGWYSADFDLTVTVEDDKNAANDTVISGGIASITWKEDGIDTEHAIADLPGTAPAYSKTFTIPVSTNGTHTYIVNAVDNAGNKATEQRITVKLDTAKPTLNVTGYTDNTWSKNDVIFTVQSSPDVTSGAICQYSTDNGASWNNVQNSSYTATESGTVKFRVLSGSGITSDEQSFTVKIDKAVPNKPTVTGAQEGWATTSPVVLTVTAPTPMPDSGIKKYYVSLDDGTTWGNAVPWNGNDATATLNITTQGDNNVVVKIVNGAGTETLSDAVNVKLDTGAPSFTTAPAVKETTVTGATITLIPDEGGKVHYIVDPASVPTAGDIKNNGMHQDVTGGTVNEFTITELAPGEKHTVYVVVEDAAGNFSDVKTVEFVTRQTAPVVSPDNLNVDYKNETITLPTGTEAYTDPDDPDGSKLPPDGSGKVTVNPGDTVCIRYPDKTVDGETVPASPGTAVVIPSRPATPGGKTLSQTDTTVTVENAVSGEEYVIVPKGDSPDWSKANTTGEFTGLSPNQGYTVYARVKAVESGSNKAFASLPSQTDVKTLVKVNAPTTSGYGAGQSGNTVPTSPAPNPGGGSITYEGGYNKEYTPSVVIGGYTCTPELTWNKDTGKGTWEYEYTVQPGDDEIDAEVVFNPRTLTGITAKNTAIFADNTANTGADALKTWLNGNQKVEAAYDNKVMESMAAAYTTADSFEQKGKVYAYTATLDGKTASMSLTVKAITAAVTASSDITKVKDETNGYTQAQLGLPDKVTVTYTGDGYTTKTEEISVTWNNESLDADFGKTATEKTFTGTIAISAWATNPGGTSATVKVKIINQTPLTDDQMTITLPSFGYGEKTAPNPSGSIVPSDTKGTFTYTYSTNGGNTWLTADQLPKSTGGNVNAGTYTVKMEYMGDKYAGSKTAAFTVSARELTVTAGTLAVTSKAYDCSTTAALTGTPNISGTASGDILTVGSFTGAYATASPGTGIKVTVTGFVLDGADKDNYKLKTGASLELTGSITKADGTGNPAYTAALAELNKVHIVTNVTPTLGTVKLPEGWNFTGDTTARLTASNDNSGKQNFGVKYTSKDANYADVTLDQPFPVSFVALEVNGGQDMRTINNTGENLTISPITLKVTGAALPNEGEYATANMEWRSSCTNIATITGNAISGSELTATVTAVKKGVSMVGVAYKNGGGMLGYILIQVVDQRSDSGNSISDIKEITNTLSTLIDPANVSETDKKVVNAVADEVTKLPKDAKETLTEQDVKPLDELKQAVNSGLDIQIIKDAQGTPPQPEAVSVVGATIASGVDSGTVKIFVTPVAPTGSDTKLELKLEMNVGGSKEQLKAPLFFTMKLPNTVDVSKLKIKHIMESGSEKISFTANGQTISFKLDNFSGLQFIVASGGSSGGNDDSGGGTGGGGSGGGSSQDAEYEFWQTVKDKINSAKNGDTVSINTKDYDKMPWYVMDALRDHPGVALVIAWNGSNTITIPAGKAQPKDLSRIYWPFSLLAELYKPGAVTDPTTSEQPGIPDKDNPSTGGATTEITAPDGTKSTGKVTSKDNGTAGTPEQADEIKQDGGKNLTIPGEDGTAKPDGQVSKDGQEDSKQADSPDADQPKKVFCLIDLISGGRTDFNCWWCWIALLAALAAITGGIVWKVKGKNRES